MNRKESCPISQLRETHERNLMDHSLELVTEKK